MLSACTDLATPHALGIGKDVHRRIQQQSVGGGGPLDLQLHTYLMNMYLRCGEPAKVLSLWSEVPAGTVSPYNSLYTATLTACAKIGPDALKTGEEVVAFLSVSDISSIQKIN